MRRFSSLAASALAATVKAASLADVCTVANVQAALPTNGTLLGINLLPSTVTVGAVYNASLGGPGAATTDTGVTYSYCNVTVSYQHTGRDDNVLIKYAFPQPSDFKSRFYLAGGGGFALQSASTGGLPYGAASGATSAGYDAFNYDFDEKVLYGNGSINWDATYAFAYTALGELTKIGKPLTGAFYGQNGTKLYTYFEGCSDGGREAMSQVQRWGEEYDGVVAGAPAYRFAQQQILHVFPATIESTMDYLPQPCALQKIVNATIAACDPLDGRTDGVISRTDLCKLNFNLTSTIGESYYCAAQTGGGMSFGERNLSKRQMPGGGASSPAQNGTITAEDVAVAQSIYDGLHDSQGKRAYLSWQIGSSLDDAEPTYNNETSAYELNIPSIGGEYVTKFIQLLSIDNLSNLDNITYDTLVEWMNIGMFRYLDSLQTTVPDLTPFQSSGAKLLHYHGESDPSIPAASSVHYWQSVRSIMYSDLSDEDALAAMSEWYQFYLVPGAAHCSVNSLQPGPYPQDNMATMIEWVEHGVKPSRLNATVSTGANKGEVQRLCQWPMRPLWVEGSAEFACVEDEESVESWTYMFDAFKVPVY